MDGQTDKINVQMDIGDCRVAFATDNRFSKKDNKESFPGKWLIYISTGKSGIRCLVKYFQTLFFLN